MQYLSVINQVEFNLFVVFYIKIYRKMPQPPQSPSQSQIIKYPRISFRKCIISNHQSTIDQLSYHSSEQLLTNPTIKRCLDMHYQDEKFKILSFLTIVLLMKLGTKTMHMNRSMALSAPRNWRSVIFKYLLIPYLFSNYTYTKDLKRTIIKTPRLINYGSQYSNKNIPTQLNHCTDRPSINLKFKMQSRIKAKQILLPEFKVISYKISPQIYVFKICLYFLSLIFFNSVKVVKIAYLSKFYYGIYYYYSFYLLEKQFLKSLNINAKSMEEQQENQPQAASQKDIEQVFIYSEFINTIKVLSSEQDYKILKPLSELESNSQLWKQITPYHFRQVTIQFFYLLYSCLHKRIVPVPEDRFICYSYDSSSVILCLNKFLTYQSSSIKDYETSTPYFLLYKNFIQAIHPFWKQSQQKSTQTSKRQTLSADYFLKQLTELIQNNEFQTQQQAFNRFQHGQMFIQTSILLRIRNSSLVCVLRKSPQLMQLYRQHRKVENRLSQEYNDRRKRKNNVEKILQTQKNIQKNIQDFFAAFKANPKYYKVEDKRKKQGGGGMTNKVMMGLKVYELLDMRQQITTHKGINTSNIQNKMNKMEVQSMQIDEDYYNLYEIQYCSSKNIIIVRMITDLVLDWATSDAILFKWNTLTFDTSNVGLETVQKLDQQKKAKKFVVIRGTSYFNKKQPVLEKMLTLIDITMATYKSIELQMKSQTFFAKNIAKIDESYKKINHYLRAIHKCCVKSYTGILHQGS